MISAESNVFEYIDRKKEGSVVLIPGWAADYRIFNHLELEFNYLIPVKFTPFTFEEDLAATLIEENVTRISLFGHSLGGFIACEFASKYPNLIDELILVSIRKGYDVKKTEEIKRHLKKNKKAYLYKFYTQSFGSKKKMKEFGGDLLKTYIEKLDVNYLIKTLDYFSYSQIKPEMLGEIKKIKIVHGEEDEIAPIVEAIEIKNNLPQARFIPIKGAGHVPFSKEGFKKDIS